MVWAAQSSVEAEHPQALPVSPGRAALSCDCFPLLSYLIPLSLNAGHGYHYGISDRSWLGTAPAMSLDKGENPSTSTLHPDHGQSLLTCPPLPWYQQPHSLPRFSSSPWSHLPVFHTACSTTGLMGSKLGLGANPSLILHPWPLGRRVSKSRTGPDLSPGPTQRLHSLSGH